MSNTDTTPARVVEVFVEGEPVPQPRAIQAATWRQKDHPVWGWRERIAWAVQSAKPKDWPLKDGYVGMSMVFVIDPKRKGRRPDLGNLIKAVEDCLEKIVYKNDVLVCEYLQPTLRRVARDGERPGLWLKIVAMR